MEQSLLVLRRVCVGKALTCCLAFPFCCTRVSFGHRLVGLAFFARRQIAWLVRGGHQAMCQHAASCAWAFRCMCFPPVGSPQLPRMGGTFGAPWDSRPCIAHFGAWGPPPGGCLWCPLGSGCLRRSGGRLLCCTNWLVLRPWLTGWSYAVGSSRAWWPWQGSTCMVNYFTCACAKTKKRYSLAVQHCKELAVVSKSAKFPEHRL